MIYNLSLQPAGLLAGIILALLGIVGFLGQNAVRNSLPRFPRSSLAGVIILALDLVWSFWIVATMEMGEFSSFRRPFLIALPIGFFLALRFVDEFLAVRALGIFLLLSAEPLLEAAFFRYETSRLLLTVLAYGLIVLGLIWVTMPYKMRDEIDWLTESAARWRGLTALSFLYGVALLMLAFFVY